MLKSLYMTHSYLRKTAWSNLFFLIPFILSIKFGILWYSIVIGVMITISTLFHLSNTFQLRYPDILISTVLIISNFSLLIMGNWKLPYSIFALITALVAITTYYLQFKNHRVFYHNVWHILSALICYFSILTFLAV